MTFEERADKLTSDWWDHLSKVGQLSTPLEHLDQMYWAELDTSIAREFERIRLEAIQEYDSTIKKAFVAEGKQ